MKKWLLPLIIIILGFGIYKIGRYYYMKPNVVLNEIAPDFRMQERNGAIFQLSDLQHQYVLLVFWGSWCGPCRRENQELKNLYSKFHNKRFTEANDFDIVGVGIEKDFNNFMDAIIQDGIPWLHNMTESKMFETYPATIFGVKEIPQTFFLGPDRSIIGINWKTEEIGKYLSDKMLKN